MIFERFYDNRLAAASYLVGCERTGEALVVDPLRDADVYVRAAEAERLRITHVTETHIHADFVSGARELAERTGARLHLSGEGGPDWRYDFAAADGAVLLRDGDAFDVGTVRVEAVHTPGHTPEHLSFLVTDTAAADRPMGAFTGDFIFVGDVGRPDLLERAAGVAGAMDMGARRLYRSLRRFGELPDHLQIWPGHGAGSACGKSPGAVPQSTLGYERLFSRAFAHEDEAAFVDAVLDGQPEPPRYFAEMKRINRAGPPLLNGRARADAVSMESIAGVLERGGVVVDTRPWADFGESHLPGALSIPLDRSFTTRAGSLLPYDRDLHLIVEPGRVDEAVGALLAIGLDRIAGRAGPEVVDAWRAGGREPGRIPGVGADDVADRMARGEIAVLDVRDRDEWAAGHLPGATHIPLAELAERYRELPSGAPIAVHCMGGARSVVAASVLRAAGIREVSNMRGGYPEWVASGRPVERDAGAAA